MPDGETIWTLVWRLEKPIIFQIQCFSERLLERRLSLILMLAIFTNKKIICRDIEEFSGFKETSVSYWMLGQRDFEENVQNLRDGTLVNELPAIIMESNIPFKNKQFPLPIISNNYDIVAEI